MVRGCEIYRNELSSYLDGQLDLQMATKLSEHLKSCNACEQELNALKRISRLFVRAQEKITAPDILASVLEKLPDTCSLVAEDLSAYIDGELAEAPSEGVRIHLDNCKQCALNFKELQATQKLLLQGLQISSSVKLDLWPAIKSHLNEDCALIQSELSSFIDQEVPALRHRAIVGHLLDCPPCHQIFNYLYQVGDFIRTNYQPTLPDDFDLWEGVKSKLQVVPLNVRAKPSKVIRPFPLKTKYAAVAASFALIFISGTFWFTSNRQANVRPITSEGYLLEQAMVQPAEDAELVLYENQ